MYLLDGFFIPIGHAPMPSWKTQKTTYVVEHFKATTLNPNNKVTR